MSRRARARAVLTGLLVPLLAAQPLTATEPRPDPPGSGHTAPGVPFGPVVPGRYSPPVQRPVVDPFHLPRGQYGPGNRGLEYGTVEGDPVHAIGNGRVVFAGPVAGRLAVSIEHPDGRRSTLTGLAHLAVRAGDLVARGSRVGTAGPGLHLGLLEGRRYVDPAPWLVGVRMRAVLVAVEGPMGGP